MDPPFLQPRQHNYLAFFFVTVQPVSNRARVTTAECVAVSLGAREEKKLRKKNYQISTSRILGGNKKAKFSGNSDASSGNSTLRTALAIRCTWSSSISPREVSKNGVKLHPRKMRYGGAWFRRWRREEEHFCSCC